MSVRVTGVRPVSSRGRCDLDRAGDQSVLPSSGENAALPPSLFGYDVISRLGQGAASQIYVVSDSTGQIYALKHVVRETDKHDRYIEQLTNEF